MSVISGPPRQPAAHPGTFHGPTLVGSPRIVPVLDLQGGLVVHAVAGDRAHYKPLRSPLVHGSRPLDIARTLCAQAQTTRLYVADLDAIQHGRPDWRTMSELTEAGFELCVDAGVRNPAALARLLAVGAHRVVIPLETSAGPSAAAEMLHHAPPDRLIFSLDLFQGRPLLPTGSDWCHLSAVEIGQTAIRLGYSALLVLDLAGVGCGAGLPTLPLCRALRDAGPAIELWTGGGVRELRDVESAGVAGSDVVLVSTALHNGMIAGPHELRGGRTDRGPAAQGACSTDGGLPS